MYKPYQQFNQQNQNSKQDFVTTNVYVTNLDYTVTEVLTDHNGFEQDAENSKNLAGTILSDETVSEANFTTHVRKETLPPNGKHL